MQKTGAVELTAKLSFLRLEILRDPIKLIRTRSSWRDTQIHDVDAELGRTPFDSGSNYLPFGSGLFGPMDLIRIDNDAVTLKCAQY